MLGFAIPVKYQTEQLSNLRIAKCERERHEMKHNIDRNSFSLLDVDE